MTHNTEEPIHVLQNSCPHHEYNESAEYIQPISQAFRQTRGCDYVIWPYTVLRKRRLMLPPSMPNDSLAPTVRNLRLEAGAQLW
jgi:hypothetical protein